MEILKSLDSLCFEDSLTVVGGSLAALNYRQILTDFPRVVI
jgi:hypothetical protein